MTETKKENKKLKSEHIELIFISIGIFLIISIWVLFPRYLFWKDSQQPQQTTQIVIPYQLDAMLKTEPTVPKSEDEETEKTQFQAIGDQFGAFGDSYGPLNTLFSGLAFAFLVASLYLQRKELQAQRIEIEGQKEEIRRGNDIAEGQRTITEQQANLIQDQITESQKQNFYSLLFQFLNDKDIKYQNLKIKSRNREIPDRMGDIFFERFSIGFLDALIEPFVPPIPNDDGSIPSKVECLKVRLQDSYKSTCSTNRVNFEENFYFEYFVFLLNFIHQNAHVHDSELVINTFLSHLTFDETICMACYAVLQNQDLRNHIERYGLLNNLNSRLLNEEQIKSLELLYSQKAFTIPKKPNLDFLFNEPI